MKVPNKVLQAVLKMSNNQPVSDEERQTVKLWAEAGTAKRQAPAAPVANASK